MNEVQERNEALEKQVIEKNEEIEDQKRGIRDIEAQLSNNTKLSSGKIEGLQNSISELLLRTVEEKGQMEQNFNEEKEELRQSLEAE